MAVIILGMPADVSLTAYDLYRRFTENFIPEDEAERIIKVERKQSPYRRNMHRQSFHYKRSEEAIISQTFIAVNNGAAGYRDGFADH
jgi:hypothetical protein